MTLARARVIKGEAAGATPRAGAEVAPRARRVPREALDARDDAARILAEAREQAEAIVAEARAAASAVAEGAAREAREAELARVAAELLTVRAAEEQRAERELDRTIELAVLLAERLVGEGLAVEPARIAALAAEALRETRGARRVRVEAHADDVAPLGEALAALGRDVAAIEPSDELARGSLIVHTELGRVDARLRPQLARLAEALREALRSPGPGGAGSAGA